MVAEKVKTRKVNIVDLGKEAVNVRLGADAINTMVGLTEKLVQTMWMEAEKRALEDGMNTIKKHHIVPENAENCMLDLVDIFVGKVELLLENQETILGRLTGEGES